MVDENYCHRAKVNNILENVFTSLPKMIFASFARLPDNYGLAKDITLSCLLCLGEGGLLSDLCSYVISVGACSLADLPPSYASSATQPQYTYSKRDFCHGGLSERAFHIHLQLRKIIQYYE